MFPGQLLPEKSWVRSTDSLDSKLTTYLSLFDFKFTHHGESVQEMIHRKIPIIQVKDARAIAYKFALQPLRKLSCNIIQIHWKVQTL